MHKRSFDEIRTNLLSRRRELLFRLDGLEDQIGAEWQREPEGCDRRLSGTLESVLTDGQRELEKIESSLRRISRREYDLCISCGGVIPVERLESSPYAVNCEACSRDFPQDYFDAIRAQHSGIREIFGAVGDELSGFVLGLAGGETAPSLRHSVLVLLGDLQRQLERHFELEERSDLAGTAASREHRSKMAVLTQEHEGFRRLLRKLMTRAAAADWSVESWNEIQGMVASVGSALLVHEGAEDRILSEGRFLRGGERV